MCRKTLGLESYSVSQSGLEQVFMDLATGTGQEPQHDTRSHQQHVASANPPPVFL